MRKVLVLLLVLGLAPLASAGMLSLQIGGVGVGATLEMGINDVLTLQVYSDGSYGSTKQYSGVLAIAPDTVHAGSRATVAWEGTTSITGVPQTAADAVIGWTAEPYVYNFKTNGAPSTTPVEAGIGFTFVLEAIGGIGDTAKINLLSDQEGLSDSVVITMVPEPMTMALLGFGGLFLRRRK